MYSFFSGKVIAIESPTLSIQIDGMGIAYDAFASPLLLSHARIGFPIEAWIHHHKTDVSESLFACVDQEERRMFRELLKVNGVGGKTALNLLGLGGENLMKAIQFEDDTLLSTVPGIGKKTAQKIIVDLKGSIDFSTKSRTPTKEKNNSDTLLMSSLVQMGYDKTRVEEIVSSIDASLSLEIRTVKAIQQLSHKK